MITVGDIKGICAQNCGGLCATDPRVLEIMSVASERLCQKGRWKGTMGRFVVSSSEQTIAHPREIETIEGMAVNNVPIKLRGDWYEFLEAGPGVLGTTRQTCQMQLIPKGTKPLVKEIQELGVNRKIRLYPQFTADNAKLVLLQGLDAQGLPVKMEYPALSGTRIDGWYAVLATPYVELSTGLFASITAVQKPVTQGHIKVTEFNTTDNSERVLGYWLGWETRPEYNISFVNGVSIAQATQYEIVGKLKPRIYRSDLDWVIPDNQSAMALACKAVWLSRNDRLGESREYMTEALNELRAQSTHLKGAQTRENNRSSNRNTAGRGVTNLQ